MNVTQGDPLDHHHQLWPVNHRAGTSRNTGRQLEGAAFQAFVIQDEPAELPAQQLHPVAWPVDEQKDLSRHRIASYARLHQLAQAIKALAHIGWLVVKVIMQGLRQSEHTAQAKRSKELITVKGVPTGNCRLIPLG